MKKTLIILSSILLVIFGSLIAIPIFFKDQIVSAVKSEIKNSLDAEVFFNEDSFSISFFRHFPTITLGISESGIVGIDNFEGDTLAYLNTIELSVNPVSLLLGNKPKLERIDLKDGLINIQIMQDGSANYDIAKTTHPTGSMESTGEFQLDIQTIGIENIDLTYHDESIQTLLILEDLEGKGSGNLSESLFEFPIEINGAIKTISYEGVSYLTERIFSGRTNLSVNLEDWVFGINEGSFSLNDFLFEMNGEIALLEEGIDYDLVFDTPKNDFKSILSLVPGIYTESFEELTTSGKMDFQGFCKGIYSEDKIPNFDIRLQIEDGFFKYPDLPLSIGDINLEFLARNDDNRVETTRIAIPTFSLKMGENPINGSLSINNLIDYDLKANLKGNFNLEEISDIFPMEENELWGNLLVDINAEGVYDEARKVFPKVNSRFILENGKIRNPSYPFPVENINANVSIVNPGQSMNDFELLIPNVGFEIEGDPIAGNLKIWDFEKLYWDGNLSGKLDLNKLSSIVSIENQQLQGVFQANINSKGSYQAIETNNYRLVEADGMMEVNDFFFKSEAYPQGIKILHSLIEFSPKRVELKDFDSQFGNSDIQASGYLGNYLNYLLSNDGSLEGQLMARCALLDLNEWMASDTQSTDEEESSLEVIPLPENLNLNISLKADEVLYDNLTLMNVNGNLRINEGVLAINNSGMETLNGKILMNGTYDPRDLSQPKFALDLDMEQIAVASAFEKFNTVQTFAPIAKEITGSFNSNLDFSGILGADLIPILTSIDLNGVFELVNASLKNNPITNEISNMAKLGERGNLAINDIRIPIKIENGTMEVKPFDIKIWDYEANIQGVAGFDGSMSYLVNMDIPVNKLGTELNKFLGSSDEDNMNLKSIPVLFRIEGTYNHPSISLAGANTMESLLENVLGSKIKQEQGKVQGQLKTTYEAVQDSIKKELADKAKSITDSMKNELVSPESGEKVLNEAKSILKSFVKKKTKPDSTKKDN